MSDFLSIIIVTFNSSKVIEKCLNSIRGHCNYPFEVIVIDNNSQDGTKAILENTDLKIQIIYNKKNLGYSKANNIGVMKSKGNILLFLNPDTVILNKIEPLINFFNYDQTIGILAPKLICNGKVQQSVRNIPTIKRAIEEFIFKRNKCFSPYIPSSVLPSEVESVVGAAMLIRKSVFLKVDGFNEKYFLYFEDLDLCRKIRKIDLKIYYYPEIMFEHKIGHSSNELSQMYLEQSANIYYGTNTKIVIDYLGRISNKFNLN